MLNTTTHRVTDLSDAEAWADNRLPARYMHTQPLHSEPYAPPTVESIREGERRMGCSGNCNQGRACDCAPKPGECSSELLADAEWRPFTLGESVRFWLAVLAVPAIAILGALAAVFWPVR